MMKRRELVDILPIVFFGALLFSRVSVPADLVFDETHYVPAARAFETLSRNVNWVHPPFAKYIMALFGLVFDKGLHLIGEPTIFRVAAACFGLWTLWGVRAFMVALGFTPISAACGVWLTGFNFLWFVQSKTAMLDIFYVAFAVWGLFDVWYEGVENAKQVYQPRIFGKFRRWRAIRGWIWLGLAVSCKWAAVPFVVLALILSRHSLLHRIAGGGLSVVVYFLTFVPLAFLEADAVSVSGIWTYHERMLRGFDSIASSTHAYASEWWQWPLMIRPMWYYLHTSDLGDRSIWAGVNPVLAWTSLPFLIGIVWNAYRYRDKAARVLASLFWVPLLFWCVTPRKLQLFYYYLAPSLWIGPIVVWAHHCYFSLIRRTRGWVLIGFVLLCGATFLYFLPIMDARLLPRKMFYQYMWFWSWV